MCSLELNKRDVAPKTRRHVREDRHGFGSASRDRGHTGFRRQAHFPIKRLPHRVREITPSLVLGTVLHGDLRAANCITFGSW
jgi:hypothetical protein